MIVIADLNIYDDLGNTILVNYRFKQNKVNTMKLRIKLIFTAVVFGILLIDIPVVKSMNNSESLLRQGIAKKIAGNQNEAIKIFDAALQQNPNLVDAYVERGDAKQRSEQYQSAISDFDRAIELNHSRHDIYLARANTKLKFKQKDFVSALSYKYYALVDYEQALELAQKEGDFKSSKVLEKQIEYIQNHFKEIVILVAISFGLLIIIFYLIVIIIHKYNFSKKH